MHARASRLASRSPVRIAPCRSRGHTKGQQPTETIPDERTPESGFASSNSARNADRYPAKSQPIQNDHVDDLAIVTPPIQDTRPPGALDGAADEWDGRTDALFFHGSRDWCPYRATFRPPGREAAAVPARRRPEAMQPPKRQPLVADSYPLHSPACGS